ncbi:hypothetical protein GCM10009864_60050 [Streptomyces lunalinharesii]|uniref:Uncharacterized protein n=1 Tax=Streptomyces lunalinharesii TaxID=333384 RepID=A0ABN3SL47_9ACTN
MQVELPQQPAGVVGPVVDHDPASGEGLGEAGEDLGEGGRVVDHGVGDAVNRRRLSRDRLARQIAREEQQRRALEDFAGRWRAAGGEQS